MNQRRRSPDDSTAAQSLDEKAAESGGAPLESGIAPRGSETRDGESGESGSLYDRLLRSGAFDEVMEVAAREMEAAAREVEIPGEAAPNPAEARPHSEVVPAGTAEAKLELEVDLESVLDEAERGEEVTPVRLPTNVPAPTLPSMMIAPEAAPRRGATERVVLKEIGEIRRPSLTPQATKPGRDSKEERAPLLALVALLCVSAGALVFWFATRPDPQATAPGARRPTPAATPDPSPPEAPEPAAAAPAPAAQATPVEAPAAVDPPPEAPEPPARAVSERRAAPGRRAAAPRPPAPAEAAATPSVAPQGAQPELPAQPSRDAVVQAMQALNPALQGCVAGAHGDLRLRMTVRGSGQVSHAVVQGAFEGTPEGSCIARAARQAQFPEFSSRFVRLTYPVRL